MSVSATAAQAHPPWDHSNNASNDNNSPPRRHKPFRLGASFHLGSSSKQKQVGHQSNGSPVAPRAASSSVESERRSREKGKGRSVEADISFGYDPDPFADMSRRAPSITSHLPASHSQRLPTSPESVSSHAVTNSPTKSPKSSSTNQRTSSLFQATSNMFTRRASTMTRPSTSTPLASSTSSSHSHSRRLPLGLGLGHSSSSSGNQRKHHRSNNHSGDSGGSAGVTGRLKLRRRPLSSSSTVSTVLDITTAGAASAAAMDEEGKEREMLREEAARSLGFDLDGGIGGGYSGFNGNGSRSTSLNGSRSVSRTGSGIGVDSGWEKVDMSDLAVGGLDPSGGLGGMRRDDPFRILPMTNAGYDGEFEYEDDRESTVDGHNLTDGGEVVPSGSLLLGTGHGNGVATAVVLHHQLSLSAPDDQQRLSSPSPRPPSSHSHLHLQPSGSLSRNHSHSRSHSQQSSSTPSPAPPSPLQVSHMHNSEDSTPSSESSFQFHHLREAVKRSVGASQLSAVNPIPTNPLPPPIPHITSHSTPVSTSALAPSPSASPPQPPSHPNQQIPTIPSYPATLASLTPHITQRSQLLKYYPGSTFILGRPFQKQWKPRYLVLTSFKPPDCDGDGVTGKTAALLGASVSASNANTISTPSSTNNHPTTTSTAPFSIEPTKSDHGHDTQSHLHIFKSSSPDEKELDRLQINEDSVVFVTDGGVDFAGRQFLMKLGGVDATGAGRGVVPKATGSVGKSAGASKSGGSVVTGKKIGQGAGAQRVLIQRNVAAAGGGVSAMASSSSPSLRTEGGMSGGAGKSSKMLWLVQCPDSPTMQKWIGFVKSAVLVQRAERAGLGTMNTFSPEGMKWDMDVMLSLRAQGLLATPGPHRLALQPQFSTSPPPPSDSSNINPSPDPTSAVSPTIASPISVNTATNQTSSPQPLARSGSSVAHFRSTRSPTQSISYGNNGDDLNPNGTYNLNASTSSRQRASSPAPPLNPLQHSANGNNGGAHAPTNSTSTTTSTGPATGAVQALKGLFSSANSSNRPRSFSASVSSSRPSSPTSSSFGAIGLPPNAASNGATSFPTAESSYEPTASFGNRASTLLNMSMLRTSATSHGPIGVPITPSEERGALDLSLGHSQHSHHSHHGHGHGGKSPLKDDSGESGGSWDDHREKLAASPTTDRRVGMNGQLSLPPPPRSRRSTATGTALQAQLQAQLLAQQQNSTLLSLPASPPSSIANSSPIAGFSGSPLEMRPRDVFSASGDGAATPSPGTEEALPTMNSPLEAEDGDDISYRSIGPRTQPLPSNATISSFGHGGFALSVENVSAGMSGINGGSIGNGSAIRPPSTRDRGSSVSSMNSTSASPSIDIRDIRDRDSRDPPSMPSTLTVNTLNGSISGRKRNSTLPIPKQPAPPMGPPPAPPAGTSGSGSVRERNRSPSPIMESDIHHLLPRRTGGSGHSEESGISGVSAMRDRNELEQSPSRTSHRTGSGGGGSIFNSKRISTSSALSIQTFNSASSGTNRSQQIGHRGPSSATSSRPPVSILSSSPEQPHPFSAESLREGRGEGIISSFIGGGGSLDPPSPVRSEFVTQAQRASRLSMVPPAPPPPTGALPPRPLHSPLKSVSENGHTSLHEGNNPRHSVLKSRLRLMSTPSRGGSSPGQTRFTPSSPVLEEDVLHSVQGHARTRSSTLDGRNGGASSVISALHSISPFAPSSPVGSSSPSAQQQTPPFILRQEDDEPFLPERTLSPPPRPRSARVSREIAKLPMMFLAPVSSPAPSPEPGSANPSSNVSPQNSPNLLEHKHLERSPRPTPMIDTSSPDIGARQELKGEGKSMEAGSGMRPHDSGVVLD